MTHENNFPAQLAERRVPCLITYLHPFRMIVSNDTTPWKPTIEEINGRNWDYVVLHEMVGGLDVGLAPPYHLVVSRAGALALPPIPELHNHDAVIEFFNKCLSALLIGGIYCEAITPDCLDTGCIIDWKYIRTQSSGSAGPNTFHKHIQHRNAGSLEAIALHNPRSVHIARLFDAMNVGMTVLERIKPMRGQYLLKGITGIARRDWGGALANLWIVVEQLISAIWEVEVVVPTLKDDPSQARKSQLSDTRTWTSSARLELLYQKGIIPLDDFKHLSAARKARNDLSHEGKSPLEIDAQHAYRGCCGLLSRALGGERPPLLDMNLTDHTISDPFSSPQSVSEKEIKFWMEIPPLPGERELQSEEAEYYSKLMSTAHEDGLS